jgi:hypothetical protein
MATEQIKRCSMSLIIREVKIKTTVRHHFIYLVSLKLTKQHYMLEECKATGTITVSVEV